MGIKHGVWAVGLLLVVSCGSETVESFDVPALEESIPEVLAPGFPGVVGEVECQEVNDSLTCTAEIAGEKVSLDVEGPNGDGEVAVSFAENLIWGDEVAQQVKQQLDTDLGLDHTVSCSPEVQIARTDRMFACTVVEPSGSPHEFVAQLLDEEGAFKLSLVVEGS
ncbi:MAG: hypothetical protein HN361_02435 [Actinobacteria bacterium]|jgi:hypothetical protein|nr:hypothetical protein [Actinomycetota bacterium]